MSSAPQCIAVSESESKSPMMMSGCSFMSSSASAPPSTAISTGWYSRMYGAQRLEVVLVVVAAHDDERVPAADLRAQRRQLRAART